MENLTSDTIDDYVSKNDRVIVLFYADWCPFCRAFLKLIEKDKAKIKHKLVGARVNEDENPLWDIFKIEVIPTLIGFSKGKAVVRKDGIAHVGLSEDDLLAIDNELR